MFAAFSPASAATLKFAFSFENLGGGLGVDPNSPLGPVRGLITLSDSAEVQAATSVRVTSTSTGAALGEYAGAAQVNEFLVRNGSVVTAIFTAPGGGDDACCFLAFNVQLDGGLISQAGLSQDPGRVSTKAFTGITITPVPIPAGGVLLLTGLVAAVGLRSLRKRAA